LSYCEQLAGAGVQQALFSQAHPDCTTGTDTSVPDSTRIMELQLIVRPSADMAVPFDFCVEDLTALQ
jgi:hypothetical protein